MLKFRLKFKTMNIFIVGPMGSGKSTVGKILSDELFLNFYDTDEEIELRTGASIDWIFDLEGEEGFRKRESEVLFEMVQKNSIVLSTGGGIILSDKNRELLSSRGTVFYLATPIYVQVERTSKDKDRPLLKNGDPTEILTKLDKERKDLYENVADYSIKTENKSSQEVASEIISLVKGWSMIERYAGKGISRYKIVITDKSIPSLELNKNISKNSKVLIITDSGIPKNYIKALKDKIKKSEVYTHIIKKGETSKSFSTYIEILTELVKLRFSRTDMIVAFGGGVVGDIAGFVASSYLRGINYIQIPTTLLSQVDSSVGGKTAINIPEGKNLVGAFYNPKLVLISTKFLQTLTDKEYKSGLGEVIKYALIDNRKLKIILEENTQKILDRDSKILLKIIEESIKTKSKIVTKDEKENNLRAILNFGHTFGHAIESKTDYKKLSHGAAITLGMIIASKISLYEGYIKVHQLDNIINLIDSLGLKTDYSEFKYNDLKKYILSDKKVADGKLNLILINNKFKAFKTNKFSQDSLKKAFK